MGQKNFDDALENHDLRRAYERISKLESRIHRRLRGKFWAIKEGWFDFDDVMASTKRRIVAEVVGGKVITASESEFEAYVWRVAYNVAIDVIRRECRRPDCHHLCDEQCGTTLEPTETDKERLDAKLRGLSGEERAIVEMRLRDLPQSVIARELGMTLEAYRSRWRRLVHRLRRVCGAHL